MSSDLVIFTGYGYGAACGQNINKAKCPGLLSQLKILDFHFQNTPRI